jgi:hypothetical protein
VNGTMGKSGRTTFRPAAASNGEDRMLSKDRARLHFMQCVSASRQKTQSENSLSCRARARGGGVSSPLDWPWCSPSVLPDKYRRSSNAASQTANHTQFPSVACCRSCKRLRFVPRQLPLGVSETNCGERLSKSIASRPWNLPSRLVPLRLSAIAGQCSSFSSKPAEARCSLLRFLPSASANADREPRRTDAAARGRQSV